MGVVHPQFGKQQGHVLKRRDDLRSVPTVFLRVIVNFLTGNG